MKFGTQNDKKFLKQENKIVKHVSQAILFRIKFEINLKDKGTSKF